MIWWLVNITLVLNRYKNCTMFFMTRKTVYNMNLTKGNLTIRNAMPSDAEQLCTWWNDGKIMAHAGFPNGLGITADDIRKDLAY